MKSVGEVMAIGRTFKEALFKGLRSLEAVKPLRLEDVSDDELQRKLARPNSQRFSYITYALATRLADRRDLSPVANRSVVSRTASGGDGDSDSEIEGPTSSKTSPPERSARFQRSRAFRSPARLSDRDEPKTKFARIESSWASFRSTNASTPAAPSLNRSRHIFIRPTKTKTKQRRPIDARS